MCVVGSGERERGVAFSPTLKLDLSHRWPSYAVCLISENHGFHCWAAPILARFGLMKEC